MEETKMNVKYIHYGHKNFSRELFRPIRDVPYLTKPEGGLWASRKNAKYGWKDWCRDSDFRNCNDDNSFSFKLTDDANVVYLKCVSDLNQLPKISNVFCPVWHYIDFEAAKDDGVDAIEVVDIDELYFSLYGWDCDSILIMNPNIIVPV
jgi:hypothetical protein